MHHVPLDCLPALLCQASLPAACATGHSCQALGMCAGDSFRLRIRTVVESREANEAIAWDETSCGQVVAHDLSAVSARSGSAIMAGSRAMSLYGSVHCADGWSFGCILATAVHLG